MSCYSFWKRCFLLTYSELVIMKRSRLYIFGTLISCSIALTSCNIFKRTTNYDSTAKPTIEVVSKIKLNLQGTNEKTISPSLSDDSIKNPVFQYSLEDESIASISGDTIKAKKTGDTKLTISVKSDSSIKTTIPVRVLDLAPATYDYTIMYYMCGSDLEYVGSSTPSSQQEFFTRDIQEILSVKNLPDSVNILIETGGTKKWGMPSSYLEGATSISSSKLQRWEVNSATGKLNLIQTLSYNEMAKTSSFQDFLDWGLTNYKAKQMGVVISGHGGGIAGCAYDDNYTYRYGSQSYPNTLQTFEVAEAADNALWETDLEKFTWIGYDCCVMQCSDIASINSEYFEYMVASQELENATGWNHDVYLPALKTNSKITPENFLPQICDSFLEENHKSSEYEGCYQTLSVLDLTKYDALISSFNAFSKELGTTSVSYSKAKTAMKSAFNNLGEKMFGLVDFVSFMEAFSASYSYDTKAVVDAIKSVVIYNKYCSKYSTKLCGLNAFLPEYLSSDREYALQVGKEDYQGEKATKFTTWQEMCLTNGNFGW